MNLKYLPNTKDIASEVSEFITLWQDTPPSLIQKTSGSTGTPKDIELKKDIMRASAQMTNAFFHLQKESSALLCISPKFIGGKMMLVRSILGAFNLTVAPISANPLKNLNHPIDFAAFVPYQIEKIIQETPEKLNLISSIIIGGAPISVQLEEKLLNFNSNAYATFGMTETVSHIALRKIDSTQEPYKRIGDTQFSTDENGNLIIHAPTLSIEALKTNDRVELIGNHSFHWLGRNDFVINSGGIKLHPETIERKIAKILGDDQFIIAGIPHESFGEEVVAITLSNTLKNKAKQTDFTKLNPYEVPKRWMVIPTFEMTKSGKIDRKQTVLKLQRSKK